MARNIYSMLIVLGVTMPFLSFSQGKKKHEYTFLSIPNIVVDGNLQEWEGQLYHADSELWGYGLALKEDSLYAAVIIRDPALQNEALTNGVIFNLSYNSKKRDGARLFFPVADREGLRALGQEDERPVNDYRKEVLGTARGYYVLGFDRVVDGLLSFQNDYKIRAVVRLDSASLLYEAVIPLGLIAFKSDDIAVKLAVNTQHTRMVRAARSQNSRASAMTPYGVYGSRPVAPKNPYSERTEIWFTGRVR